jgi:hypothetical protein
MRFVEGEPGLAGWSLRGATSTALDGLPTSLGAGEPANPEEHPNGVSRIDHVVVFTPDLSRTRAALESAGFDLRRIREASEPGPPVRQAFFRVGEVLVEVVEAAEASPGPARFWGITFRVADLERAAELLGSGLGEPRDAVQPGRRIATARGSAGLGMPVALIDDPPR